MTLLTTFFDTWGWVALGHRRDAAHVAVLALYDRLKLEKAPLLTSDFVLCEVATLLFSRVRFIEAERFMGDLFEAVSRGKIVVEPITSERFSRAWDLWRKFRDKPEISFTDLSSMALMVELDLTRIVTQDRHFLHVGLGFQMLP